LGVYGSGELPHQRGLAALIEGGEEAEHTTCSREIVLVEQPALPRCVRRGAMAARGFRGQSPQGDYRASQEHEHAGIVAGCAGFAGIGGTVDNSVCGTRKRLRRTHSVRPLGPFLRKVSRLRYLRAVERREIGGGVHIEFDAAAAALLQENEREMRPPRWSPPQNRLWSLFADIERRLR